MPDIIRSTSRDFNTVKADINSNAALRDKPDWWKNMIAGLADWADLYNNASYNNSILRTSFTRQRTSDLLELIDYYLGGQSTAVGTLLFYVRDSATFPFTLQTQDLAALSQGTLLVSSKRYEARDTVTIDLVTEGFVSAAVNISTDSIAVTTDYVYTGHKVRLETDDTLPAPLTNTDSYYMIVNSPTSISLATSIENALNGVAIDLTDIGVGNHTLKLYSKAVTCYQQNSVDDIIIGDSDASDWQTFSLPDRNVLTNTITAEVNGDVWTNELGINSGLSDKHFRMIPLSDQEWKTQFGNDEYGAIPQDGFSISVSYAYGGGAESNVSKPNSVNNYAGTSSDIGGVSNANNILTGGDNEEAVSNAKIVAPILLKARNTFVMTEDGEAIALGTPGIAQSKVFRNAFGPLSCNVLTVANGGGSPDSSVRDTLKEDLISKSILESIDVRVPDTTTLIILQNTIAAAKIKAGFVWSGQVDKYFDLAWSLFWTETSNEILTEYLANGISGAVTKINAILGFTFESSDYSFIEPLVENIVPRQFGVSVQESNAFSYVETYTPGVQYMTIASPSFPVTLASDQITGRGTRTLTEIS